IAAFDASPALSPGHNVVESALAALLASGAAPQQLDVIVTWDPSLTDATTMARALQGLGAGIIGFRQLPMYYALGSPAAVAQMSSITGVVSVYRNRQLTWFLHESVATIKADQAQALGWTGTGMGVAILDSGVDGLYNPGLTYPSHTIANVKYIVSVKDL